MPAWVAALRCTAPHGAVLVAALLQIPARSLRPMLRSTAHDSHGSGAGTTNSSAQGGAHTSSASHQPPPSFELDEPSHLGAAHSRRPIVRADGHARHLPAPMPPPTTWMAMLLPMDYEPRVQVAYRDYRRAPLYLLSVRLRTLRSTMIVPWVHTASTTSRAAVAAVLRRGVAVASSGLLWTARARHSVHSLTRLQPPPSAFVHTATPATPAIGAGVAVMSKARYSQWLMAKFTRDCTSRAFRPPAPIRSAHALSNACDSAPPIGRRERCAVCGARVSESAVSIAHARHGQCSTVCTTMMRA